MRVTKPSVKSMEFTREQMLEWFNKVHDPENWKNPIDTVIDKPSSEDMVCISDAIGYFAGGGTQIIELPGNKIRVTAPGYYMLIGA
jgi:hypothetical protein